MRDRHATVIFSPLPSSYILYHGVHYSAYICEAQSSDGDVKGQILPATWTICPLEFLQWAVLFALSPIWWLSS